MAYGDISIQMIKIFDMVNAGGRKGITTTTSLAFGCYSYNSEHKIEDSAVLFWHTYGIFQICCNLLLFYVFTDF
jgi:hypothetical protein